MVAANEHPRVAALRRAEAMALERIGLVLANAQQSQVALLPDDMNEAKWCGSLLGQSVGAGVLFRYLLTETELRGVDAGLNGLARIRAQCDDFERRLLSTLKPKLTLVGVDPDEAPAEAETIPPPQEEPGPEGKEGQ